MTTVAARLRAAAAALPRRIGIPDPIREARWLLAAAWGVSETWLRAHADEQIPEDVAARFDGWVMRRAAGEPAEHLTGFCDFWGRRFEVSPATLVPRPETELTVEVALALPLSPMARVLDVGTGSGCLAVTLALERPAWSVLAVDRSPAALVMARRNARRFGASVIFACDDLATAVTPPVDLVVANLPYVPTPAMALLPLEVRHDPPSALDGGADGLDLVRRLVIDLPRFLRVCGGAILELGEDQAETVATIARHHGLVVARRIRDVSGCERVLVLQPT